MTNPPPATFDSELRRWRADSPAADGGRIHLNNAGASLMPRPVLAVDFQPASAEIGGHDARDVMQRLREEAINTGTTLREFAVLDMDDKRAASALRVSPHYFNTVREIDTLVSALDEFVVA